MLGLPLTLAVFLQLAMSGQPPYISGLNNPFAASGELISNWDSFHHRAATPTSVFIGVLQQKLTEVLGNPIILTEFCKFHIPRQVLYFLCSFAVNKFVFPCLPLSCVVPFEAAPCI